MDGFKLVSEYQPTGDQPAAIDSLVNGLNAGMREQTLLGVTGSGKTFTMANVIARVNRPTLVLAHNKTLAAQLCSELKEFFPENAVEYFVSYYDYYQPEAYIPHTDLYIEKDMSINDEIDRLRHSATYSLFERRDVIIVASVSCIYTLGDPESYKKMVVSVREGQKCDRDELMRRLIQIRYNRNDIDLARGTFRSRGDVLEVFPVAENESVLRIEFFDDEVDRICELHPVTGEVKSRLRHAAIYPAMHYVAEEEQLRKAVADILAEMEEREKYFLDHNQLLEAQRIRSRTLYDVEFLTHVGYCKGVENYSRILAGRPAGSTPYTLLDYFPDDYLMIVDESHVTLPQVRGMSGGDRARKKNLVDFGFRLPSAYDNRPLFFDEFDRHINQVIYVSATPAAYEKERSGQIVEQIIRPTGLVDPEISVRPSEGQIDDLLGEIYQRVEKKERVLVVTLTKRMAESLTDYMKNMDINVRYMHHDVDTLDRIQLLRDLRMGEFDVLVGINLLREEGFVRNETSLVQIIGRAARNAKGKVIMYADSVTEAMEKAIRETERRRKIQTDYNTVHGIVPKTIIKSDKDTLAVTTSVSEMEKIDQKTKDDIRKMTKKEKDALIEKLTSEMSKAAKQLDFEYAAQLRDRLKKLKSERNSK